MDEDVDRERQNVTTGNLPSSTAVTLYNLRKEFRNGFFKDPKKDFVAVRNSTFHIDAGQLFCLLG
jgi:ABC-type multidrug transport system ATPase subunit